MPKFLWPLLANVLLLLVLLFSIFRAGGSKKWVKRWKEIINTHGLGYLILRFMVILIFVFLALLLSSLLRE